MLIFYKKRVKCEPENNIISQYSCTYFVLCLTRLSKYSKSAINMGFKNKVMYTHKSIFRNNRRNESSQ